MLTALRRNSFPLACVLALLLFALKAVFIASASIRGLGLTPWIIDDAFIVMKVARNIALGLGFTYDGVHATTGAPPLWAYAMSINHLLFSLPWAVKATIIEMAFLGALSGILSFLIARKVSGKAEAGWIALALTSLTGNNFYLVMNGMETSMFTFFILLSVALWLEIGRPAKVPRSHWMLLSGLALGLGCMVRGDGLVVMASLLVTEIILALRAPRSEWREKAYQILPFVIAWALPVLLLFSWQFMRTGSLLLGNQVGRREIALALHNFSYEHFVFSTYAKIVIWNVFQLLKLMTVAFGSWLVLLLALLLPGERASFARLRTMTLIYTLLFSGALVLYQWYFPDLHGLRYLVPLTHLTFALGAGGIVSLSPRIHRGLLWGSVALLIIVTQYEFEDYCIHLKWAQDMSFFARPTATQIEEGWAAIDWANAHLPPSSVVAVRDHGRFALFTNVRVQDIAGTVDPTVPKLAKSTGLKEYLTERGITHALVPPTTVRGDLVYRKLFQEFRLKEILSAPHYGLARFYEVR